MAYKDAKDVLRLNNMYASLIEIKEETYGRRMQSRSNRVSKMPTIKDLRLDNRWFMNLELSFLAATMKREI